MTKRPEPNQQELNAEMQARHDKEQEARNVDAPVRQEVGDNNTNQYR